MKTKCLWLLWILIISATSCSTDIDLYADYKDIPVIYGLLDCEADTNFIKITRAIYASDNPLLDASDPDLNNYPGKLDVRLTEFCNGDSIRQIVLDTITLHNKQNGVFYAPNQKVYYTTEPLGRNTSRNQYQYRLTIVLPDRTLSTDAKLVGSSSFGPKSLALNFSHEYFGTRRPFQFRPAINATVYSVDMSFYFKEQRTPESDTVKRSMMWHIGTFFENDLIHQTDGEDYCIFYYRPENFYKVLEDFIGGDTAILGLKRYITDYPATITITAGGDNLQRYLYYNDIVSQSSLNEQDFSVIDGAVGFFSSTMTRTSAMRLAGTTLPELIAEEKWGFVFMGGSEL